MLYLEVFFNEIFNRCDSHALYGNYSSYKHRIFNTKYCLRHWKTQKAGGIKNKNEKFLSENYIQNYTVEYELVRAIFCMNESNSLDFLNYYITMLELDFFFSRVTEACKILIQNSIVYCQFMKMVDV